LKTGYLGVAKFKSGILASNIKKLFYSLRSIKIGMTDEITPEQIQEIINQYIRNELKRFEDYRVKQGLKSFSEVEKYDAYLEGEIGNDSISLQQGDYHQVVPIVEGLMDDHDFDIELLTNEFISVCREFLKSRVKMHEVERNRNGADYSDNVDELFPIPDKPETITESEVITLSDLIFEFIKEKKIEGCAETTIIEYISSLHLFVFVVGNDTPIDTIDKNTMREYKKTLQKLPKNIFKLKKFADKNISEILAMKDKNIISTSRANHHLTVAGALLEFAVNQGYLTKINPARGLKTKQRTRPDQQRDAFDASDLEILFSMDNFVNMKNPRPERFWVPVLGLYTGCRIEEICQLYLEDIQEEDGIWFLDINSNAPDKKLKNKASERIVPLHPFIVNDLNFMGFVEKLRAENAERLFPALKMEKTKYSSQPGKWFGRYKKRLGFPTGTKVFHSLRHSLTDNLKQQMVSPLIIDELTGHAHSGESMSRYGKPYVVKTLYEEAISKLNYQIDLSHLKNSKYVVG